MNQVIKRTLHERIQDIIIRHLQDLSGSQLICFQVISHLTTRVRTNKVAISLDEFESLTGLSRKTVIKSLKFLLSNSLIGIDNDSDTRINKYSIRRDKLQQLEKKGLDREKILNSVISKHQRIEKLHLEDEAIPLEIKKVFDLWNTYMYKWLDITNEMHVKYVQCYLKNTSVEDLLKAVVYMINSGDFENTVFDESDIVELFEFKGV